jgi:hypothetical protein
MLFILPYMNVLLRNTPICFVSPTHDLSSVRDRGSGCKAAVLRPNDFIFNTNMDVISSFSRIDLPKRTSVNDSFLTELN